MNKQKADYKAAMADLRGLIEKENYTLLSRVERYVGELRRKTARLTMRIAELERCVASKEAQIADLKPLLSLHDQIAELEKAKESLANERDELRAVLKEWQEIDNEKSTFVKVKAKCMKCSLHFIICTWSPETHTAKTIVCPECGQRKGHFLIWKELPAESRIFESVPGTTPFTEFGPLQPDPRRN